MSKHQMKPSNFMEHPFSSVLKNNESETIARNIMVILERTGDAFRELTWDEYKEQRFNDGNFSERERSYFDKVVGYCVSAQTAILFSPTWKAMKPGQS